MKSITMNRKGGVTLPVELRRALRLRKGQKLMADSREGILALVPVRAAADLRGFLAGIGTSVPREPDRVRALTDRP